MKPMPPIACPADLDNGSGTGTTDGGVDINDLLYFLTQFETGSTAADLDKWWKPEFTVDSTGVGEPPAGTWMTDATLDGYFANPAPLPQ